MNGDVCMRLEEFLRSIIDGECSYTWGIPVEIQRPCLSELRDWVKHRFARERSVPSPREISWKIYRRDAVYQRLQPTAAGTTTNRRG